MRRTAALLAVAFALLAACNKGPNPYRQAGNPPGQNPAGTPADRTGGAKNTPDPAGGGPGTKTTSPADQKH
jgi:hypothetical protein